MALEQKPTFGALLKRYRIASGLTQEDLAAQAGMSTRGVSDLERGARRAPYKSTIALLSEALHLSAQEHAALVVAAGRGAGCNHDASTLARPRWIYTKATCLSWVDGMN